MYVDSSMSIFLDGQCSRFLSPFLFCDEINQINATIRDYKNSCFLYIWWFMARLLLNR